MAKTKSNSDQKLISPLAIDMGATRTGCMSLTYSPGEEPIVNEGFVIMVEANDITLSQENRRAKRHQRRGYKRFKMLRRLLYVILEHHYKIKTENMSSDAKIQLQSLITRRGFSYESADAELVEKLEGLSTDDLKLYFPELKLKDYQSFLTEFEKLTGETNFNPEWLLNPKEELIEEIEDNDEKKRIKQAIKTLKDLGAAMIKARETGVRHRTVYFDEIRNDLPKHKELHDLLKKHNIKIDNFLNLICNLSNLPTKPLRRYFNDKTMEQSDYWDDRRLGLFYSRWLRSWHTDKDSPQRKIHTDLMNELAQSKDIISFLESTDPTRTVPPYEDQNNRRPPLCRTLKLDAVSLDRNYAGWHKSLCKLIKEDVLFQYYAASKEGEFKADDDLDKILKTHKQTHQSYHKKDKNGKPIKIKGKNETSLTAASVLLQRFLDRSKSVDPWHIRNQLRVQSDIKTSHITTLSKSDQKAASEAYLKMKELLGESNTVQFLRLAAHYYRETEQVRRGFWEGPSPESKQQKQIPDSHNDETLFFRCDTKTGSKQNNQTVLVGTILSERFSEDSFLEFQNKWRREKEGNSTARSLCKNIEDTRKKYGEMFAVILSRETYKKEKKSKDFDKNIVKVNDLTAKAVELLKRILNHNDQQASRYNNPFSLAQLYNLMEVDRAGFSSICKACAAEEQWRSESTSIDSTNKAARANKLSADTGRPFDGQLGYLLDRIAKVAVAEKIKQINAVGITEISQIEIPILIEQNSFSFKHDLLELKKKPKKQRDELLNRIKELDNEPVEKSERIKQDTGELCPYTGKKIGSGEIDHIIPRSATRDIYGTVFDSEINLIYSSTDGNRKKSNQLYSFKNLNDQYLQSQFQTTDREAIQNSIRTTIEELIKTKQRIVFDQMSKETRRDLRHALFDQELRELVFENLMSRSKSRVNGTQLYFAKLLRRHFKENLHKQFPKVQISLPTLFFDHRKDSLGMYRKALADRLPQYKKEEVQGDPSHIIDATMVYGCALSRPESSESMASALTPSFDQPLGDQLALLLPKTMQFLSIKRRKKYNRSRPHAMPLFKDSVYGERFLPILITPKEVRVGFHLKNSLVCTSKKKKQDPIATDEFFFNSIKPYLLFKKKPIENANDIAHFQKLAENDTRGFVILPVNKQKAIEYVSDKTKNDDAKLILDSLRYVTKRTSINSVFFDQTGKYKHKAASPSELAKAAIEKDCTIKIALSIQGTNLLSGNIQFPGYQDWLELLQKEPIKKALKEDSFNREFLESEQGRSVLQEFFKNSASKQFRHERKRGEYALMIASSSASGTRIRIKRKAFSGDPVYQLIDADDSTYSGFAFDETNGFDINNSVFQRTYLSKNTTPVNSAQIPPKSVSFDEYRRLQLDEKKKQQAGIIELQMAPGTASRAYIKLELNRLSAQKLLQVTDETLYAVKAKTKIDKSVFDDTLKPLNLPEPRDQNITITSITPDAISIEYNGSHNASIRLLYAKGEPI